MGSRGHCIPAVLPFGRSIERASRSSVSSAALLPLWPPFSFPLGCGEQLFGAEWAGQTTREREVQKSEGEAGRARRERGAAKILPGSGRYVTRTYFFVNNIPNFVNIVILKTVKLFGCTDAKALDNMPPLLQTFPCARPLWRPFRIFFVCFLSLFSFLCWSLREQEKRERERNFKKAERNRRRKGTCEGRPRRRPRSGRGHRPRETVPEEPGHPGVAYSTPRTRRSQEKRISIRGWLALVSSFDVFQDAPEGEGPAQGCQRVQAA